MKKEVCCDCINLRCRKLPSTRILSVYSKEYGLVKLSGSKLGGRAQSFICNKFWIELQEGKDIYNIKHSEFIKNFSNLEKDLLILYHAFFYVEILEQASHFHDEKSEKIFNLLYKALEYLDELAIKENNNSFVLCNTLYFLWNIIILLGYEPVLNIKDNFESENKIIFDFENGLIDFKAHDFKFSKDFCVELLPNSYKAFLNLEKLKLSNIEDLEKTINLNDKLIFFLINTLQRYLQIKIDRKFKSFSCLIV